MARSSPRKKPPTPTLLITATSLRRIVSHVLPLADDGELHNLNAVRIERRGQFVTATATDRYRLGISRVPHRVPEDEATPDESTNEFSVVIPRASLTRLFSLFKVTRRSGDPLLRLIQQDEKTLVVEKAGGIFDLSEARVGLPLVASPYPVVDEMLARQITVENLRPIEVTALNPRYLADFQHAATVHEPLILHGSESPLKPVVVTVGDHFIGMLMAIRMGTDAAANLDAWRAFLPSPKTDAEQEAKAS